MQNKQKQHNESCKDTCVFCLQTKDDENVFGRFLNGDVFRIHHFCLLFACGLPQRGSDSEGILGFFPEDIIREQHRGARLRCRYCKRKGATIGCSNRSCRVTFHLPCGIENGSFHQFYGTFPSFCKNHRLQQSIPHSHFRKRHLYDCPICTLPIEKNKFFFTPCCQKLFHHRCIQNFAVNSGYFFRCPLCNNKDEFVREALEFGVYVPEQDASWELETNAYSELLYRHSSCDALVCLCAQGRNYNEGKWKIIICNTCGSKGCHTKCGKLPSIRAEWECSDCNIVEQSKQIENHETFCKHSNHSNSDNDNRIATPSDEQSTDKTLIIPTNNCSGVPDEPSVSDIVEHSRPDFQVKMERKQIHLRKRVVHFEDHLTNCNKQCKKRKEIKGGSQRQRKRNGINKTIEKETISKLSESVETIVKPHSSGQIFDLVLMQRNCNLQKKIQGRDKHDENNENCSFQMYNDKSQEEHKNNKENNEARNHNKMSQDAHRDTRNQISTKNGKKSKKGCKHLESQNIDKNDCISHSAPPTSTFSEHDKKCKQNNFSRIRVERNLLHHQTETGQDLPNRFNLKNSACIGSKTNPVPASNASFSIKCHKSCFLISPFVSKTSDCPNLQVNHTPCCKKKLLNKASKEIYNSTSKSPRMHQLLIVPFLTKNVDSHK